MALRQNKNSISNPETGISWWFVFKDMERPLLSRLLKREYQHVFALTRMKNLVLVNEPLMGAVNLMITDAPLAEILAEHKLQGHHVVHFRHPPKPEIFKMRGPALTCASYLAYTVGIPFYGLTAYQLYKKLIKLGGEKI